jgi:hypothetical protein
LTQSQMESCGCLQNRRNRTHGLTGSPEYGIWVGMQSSCLNPAQNGFKSRGARGIEVCEQWLGSFDVFIGDVGMRPTPMHWLRRKDTRGNFEPSNVHWRLPGKAASPDLGDRGRSGPARSGPPPPTPRLETRRDGPATPRTCRCVALRRLDVLTVRVVRQGGPSARALHKARRRFAVGPRAKAVQPAWHVNRMLHMIVTKHAASPNRFRDVKGVDLAGCHLGVLQAALGL